MSDIESLVENLAREAKPVKPAPHPLRLSLFWLAGAAVYLALTLWISGFRPDLMRAIRDPWYDAEIAALFLIFISTTLSAAVLAFPDLHQMPKLVLAPIGAFAFLMVILYFAWRTNVPPPPMPVHSYQCTISITLVSLLPATWTFLSMRGFASTHSRWAGSIALLSSFSVGALWLRLHELNDSIVHVVEWHYLPMLCIGLVGWWIGKRLLKW